jgi:hypothetical protein
MPKRMSLVSTALALGRVLPSGADITAFARPRHCVHSELCEPEKARQLFSPIDAPATWAAGQGRWSRALVKGAGMGPDARAALAGALWVSAENIRVRDGLD